MFWLFFLICLCTIQFQTSSLIETKGRTDAFIVIEPVTSREFGLYVVKREQDLLNITCSVHNYSSDAGPRYSLSWTVPRTSTNSNNHIITKLDGNSVSLMITHLEPRDEGTYSCDAQPLDASSAPLNAVVIVNIINDRECGETMFTCNISKYGNCIHRRFTCDGYQDCEKGEDEDQDMCGPDPCTNKLPCQDHPAAVRCIPKAWCCNIRMDVNCTVKEPLSCCPNPFQNFMDDRRYYSTLKPHYYDMAFAIYTVIGCAVVFMVVIAVLVIAICRVYTRTQWPPRSTHITENAAAIYEVDMYCRGPSGLLVTYNMAQTVGRAVQPPPYSQAVPIPPKEGPPPPYTPLDMPEAEALLSQSFARNGVARIAEDT